MTQPIPVPDKALLQLAEIQGQLRATERTIRNALDVPDHFVLSPQLRAFVEPPASEEPADA